MKRATDTDATAADARLAGGLPDTEETDRRQVRVAFAVAVGLHLVLFSLQLPEMTAEVQAATPKPLFAVKPTPFRPPEPDTRETLPRETPVKVPVPDPTPDELEPLVSPTRIEVPIELSVSDPLPSLPGPPPEPEPERPLLVGGPVQPPVRVYSPPPRYTEIARKARIQGSVIVSAVIDKEGRVARAEVLKALPMGLDRAAIDAISEWTFEPATLRGEPVAVFYNLTVHFKLN